MPLNGRILALDVGKRRIGLAVSDPLGITAQGLDTLERSTTREDYAALARLAAEHGAALILVGNPINMGGREGRQAGYVRHFAAGLAKRAGVPVKFWDERLTTVEANRVLRESGIGIEKRARAVDRLSAVILLQSYLDSLALAGRGAGFQPAAPDFQSGVDDLKERPARKPAEAGSTACATPEQRSGE